MELELNLLKKFFENLFFESPRQIPKYLLRKTLEDRDIGNYKIGKDTTGFYLILIFEITNKFI